MNSRDSSLHTESCEQEIRGRKIEGREDAKEGNIFFVIFEDAVLFIFLVNGRNTRVINVSNGYPSHLTRR